MLLVLLFWVACPALALEFRSIAENAAVMYEAPTLDSRKISIITRYYPVEVLVTIEGWSKVRDRTGALAWVQRKSLSDKRTVLVNVPLAEIRREASNESPILFKAEQNVALEWVEAGSNGWSKVRHHDGQTGYIRINQVWGL